MPTLAAALLFFPQESPVAFSEVAGQAGIRFEHVNGASSDKFMPETMGSGVLVFDYDNDFRPDVLFVDGGSFVDVEAASRTRHRLYRNVGDPGAVAFADVTEGAGLGRSRFGMGACAADYDNDGWTDLYVTAFGGNTLYRNVGGSDASGRSFVDVSAEAGTAGDGWSSSCAFGDVDNDGDVDLYVANYVDFDLDNNKYCGDVRNVRFYCHPNIYNGVADVLYRNDGDGTFTDVTRESGVWTTEGKGLGVVFVDFDDDGNPDIYVANDSTPNFLYRNRGDGTFEETGLLAGVAVGMDGQPLAGMGTDAGDVDGDGRDDLIVTNLDHQTHTLYRGMGSGLFVDTTYESGIGEATLPYVGFGTVLFDYDNDGDLDLAIANGDVLDNVELLNDSSSYAQSNLLLRNDGAGHFDNVTSASGAGFGLQKVSRGLVTGDLDADGDLDLLVSNNGARPDLLRNDQDAGNNSLQVRLVGVGSNADGIGARLRLQVGQRILVRTVRAGSSYLGQSDRTVHFGLGAADTAGSLEIRWPGGDVEILTDLDANQLVVIEEGRGIVEGVPRGNVRAARDR